MGARAPFNAVNLLLFLIPPGGIRTGPRASSMRPASHANLHLINTRGVFAARAACVPICAFCIWRFYAPRPHRFSSSFSRMTRSFSTAAMRRRQAASSAACRRSSRAWACSARAIPEKTGADSPGSKCSPAQSPQGHHAMKEGAKKVPAHPPCLRDRSQARSSPAARYSGMGALSSATRWVSDSCSSSCVRSARYQLARSRASCVAQAMLGVMRRRGTLRKGESAAI